MLEQIFSEVYIKFKLHFYQETFGHAHIQECNLTTVEMLCMEVIQALQHPTINEFAAFMQISQPNAAYKVSRLIQKGYLRKVRSQQDHREYYLEPTPQYFDDYNANSTYAGEIMDRISTRFSSEDCQKLAEILTVVSRELMPEVELDIPEAKS